MGKKKATSSVSSSSRVRVELRLDEEVYDRVKKLADGAQITVNQLINGMSRWAGDNGHIGEPLRNQDGVLQTRQMAGIVWFGKSGYYLEDEDKAHYWKDDEQAPDFIKGEHVLTLDFTERRVVREDL